MKIYFIAISGKGSGNLAVFLKQQGHEVYGSEYSEKTFYPPIADLIRENRIPVDFGFDPDKITPDIDLVILGGAALIHDKNNPQVKRAKELGIEIITTARGIGRFISKDNHISVVGNHGKTTTTALIAKTLISCNEDASYFIGEAPFEFANSIYSGTSSWSVAEGDEHPSLGQEEGGKFLYHKPKHVVFISADWDHKNVYQTLQSYLDAYIQLMKILPSDGKLIACLDGINVCEVLQQSRIPNPITFYTIGELKNVVSNVESHVLDNNIDLLVKEYAERFPDVLKQANYVYYIGEVDYRWMPDSTRFLVKRYDLNTKNKEKIGYFETHLIGQIGLENSLATIATLLTLGFDIEGIKKGISEFKGVRRRLEMIYNRDYKVINDFAHSPIKIKSTLQAVRTKFYDRKIFVIFQVGQSALKEKRTFYELKNVFNLADYVIIPRVIPDVSAPEQIFGKDYRDLIKAGASEGQSFLKPQNVFYTPLTTHLKSVLENNLGHNDVIVIMSSTDNTEIIELVKGLQVKSLPIN